MRRAVNIVDSCPRCGLTIEQIEPKVGEVWLRTDKRKLYVVVHEREEQSRPYAVAERLHPRGPQGCDPYALCAMWPDVIRRGEWIKVEGMVADEKAEEPR